MRGSASPASGGQSSMSRGHHANSSCSWSGVTVLGARRQPRLSDEHHEPVGQPQSASPRTRSGATAHSSCSSRTSVSAGFSPRSTAPPAPSAQRPAHEATHGARRPASQRPSAERVTHSAATLSEASPATSRSAQRSGCSSIAIPPSSAREVDQPRGDPVVARASRARAAPRSPRRRPRCARRRARTAPRASAP